MRRNVRWVILLLLVAFASWWFFLRPSSRLTEEPHAPAESEALSNGPGIARLWNATREVVTKPRIHRTTPDVDDEWRTPLSFYGRVIDQNGDPVEGAVAELSWNNLSGTDTKQVLSDSQGMFFLLNQKGKDLVVRVSKKNYYTSKRDQVGFSYAGENLNFVPNPASPVVFHLNKKGRGEPLIAKSGLLKLPKTGEAVEMDLYSGKVVAPGRGTIVLAFASSQVEKPARKRYHWKLQISAPGGGLLQADEEFPFLAPAEGYQSDWEFEPASVDERIWESSIDRNLFIKLPDGRFARISFTFLSHNGAFRFESFVNPSGSRNLEFDYAAQPKPAVLE